MTYNGLYSLKPTKPEIKKIELKPAVLRLKIYLVSNPAHGEIPTLILDREHRYNTSSSSSSYRAGSTDIPDPLSPFLPIVHRPRQVFRTTTCILT